MYSQAEELSRRAFDGRERVLGPEHPATLTSMNNLGIMLAAGAMAALLKLFIGARWR
jgi:hypothetical protein